MIHNRFKKCFKKMVVLLCTVATLFTSDMAVQAKDASTAIRIGIDVSRYQGNINWGSVAASGVSYTFVRVGSVKYGIDSKFDQNMRAANAAGVQTGVYIYSYAQNVQEAAAEAMFVISALANYTVSMPVVIDIEDSTQEHLSPQALADIANTFCAIVESAGYYPMVYANKYWFTKKIGPVAYDKWVAQYNSYCAIEDAAFWQASDSGAIAGITGAVDIDYQYKDLSTSIIANGFVYRKGFFYFYENYKMKVNSLVTYNGGVYYVDQFGRRVSGFLALGDGMYYFDQNGLMLTGWQTLGGNTYYFGTDGKMSVGLTKIGDLTFMFDGNGCLYRGWLTADSLYYFYEDGHMATGLSPIGTALYYFNQNGQIQLGWQNIGGADYFFDLTTAQMMTGWVNTGTGVYYFDPATGIKQTGWLLLGNDVYYLGTDGKCVSGIHEIGGVNYYFGPDGKRQTGFATDGINMYYFDPATAAQVKGWVAIDGSLYLMDPVTGSMTVGTITIGANEYYFDATGKMQTGFVAIGNAVYFYNPADGTKMRGLITDGVYNYYMDPTDGHLVVNTTLTFGESIWVADEFGHITVVQ